MPLFKGKNNIGKNIAKEIGLSAAKGAAKKVTSNKVNTVGNIKAAIPRMNSFKSSIPGNKFKFKKPGFKKW